MYEMMDIITFAMNVMQIIMLMMMATFFMTKIVKKMESQRYW